ncbi:chromosomal replication initiator protein DnaA [Planctomicrobium sp. SH664]|uniref:chromosomal replication initiator protein DnaA n=1 Tax=Planctomicrobium sp. SH664 TaxID=3448125 RepID=UPI003F5AE122
MLPAKSSFAPPGVLDEIRNALQAKLGSRRYLHWFGTSTRLEQVGAELVVHVASPYLHKWIQRQFQTELSQIAARFIGPDAGIRYEIGGEVLLTPVPTTVADDVAPQPSVVRRTTETPRGRTPHTRGKRTYSLHDFVMGEANALAVAAAQRVTAEPGCVTPLYLHGTVGNGKTHLLEAIRSRLRKEHPQLQVLLLTAEQFGNYFSQALDARSLPSFRAKFRNVDVLLIDDIDFFDGKRGFQEEFLHTVKQFEGGGRQLVVTSSRHPRLLAKTSEELVTRFLSGVVCRLEAPDEMMRGEIVRRHATRQRAKFSEDSLDHVAARFTSNVRELEGAINLLATWGQMSKQKVTVGIARKLLGRLERDCVRIVRLADVEQAVCEFFGVQAEALRSNSRKQSVSHPRMVAMYLSRRLTQTAYSEIGEYFGGRNHSTVMSAERKITGQLGSETMVTVASESWRLKDILETLQDRIKAG